MLVNKELKAKKEINSIKAEWSRAHKDITKVKIAVSDELADALAREQAKNNSAWKMERSSNTLHWWQVKTM